MADIEVLVLSIGTVGKRAANKVGPVPDNLSREKADSIEKQESSFTYYSFQQNVGQGVCKLVRVTCVV